MFVGYPALVAQPQEGLGPIKRRLGQAFLYTNVGIVLAGIVDAGVLGSLIYGSIAGPVGVISRTVDEVSAGNYDTRCGVAGADELGELGSALDHLLEDKVTTFARARTTTGP